MRCAKNILYWLAAVRLPVGPVKFRERCRQFDTIEDLFAASTLALQQVGFKPDEIQAIKNPEWDKAKQDLVWCEKMHCHIVPYDDRLYPRLLREISNAPLVLFVQGDAQLLAEPQIAMVGSRQASAYGRDIAKQFALRLAEAGLAVTSGLAAGIDTACHRGALAATGKTIAVTAAGLQHIYPRENRRLAQDILTKGALISEFPPDVSPLAKHFPQRNRVISGLSLGVVVVEAALQSGSLITARLAAEQGREVFAVPGSLHNPLTRGCHQLIRQGAKLVEIPTDILEELGPLYSFAKQDREIPQAMAQYAPIPEHQRRLLALIGMEEVTALDTIMVKSGLTMGEVSSMLLSLELDGYVSTVPGGYVRDKSRDGGN